MPCKLVCQGSAGVPGAGEVGRALSRLQAVLPGAGPALAAAARLVAEPEFQLGLEVAGQLEAVWGHTGVPPLAVCCEAQELAEVGLSVVSELSRYETPPLHCYVTGLSLAGGRRCAVRA